MKFTIFLLLLFFINTTFAQNCADFNKFPLGETTAISLYDSLKTLVHNEDYETALEIWQTLSKYSPTGDSTQYRYGITIFTVLLTKEKNEKHIESYQDEIINIYETHLTCLSPILQDSGKILESYAYSLSEIGYEDSEKTLSVYQKAIEINGNQTSPYILAYFADHVVWMFGNDLLDKTNCIKIYNQLKNIKDANIENQAYLDNWEYVKDYFEPLFPVRTFDCEYFELKIQAILKENSTDKVEIQKMIDKLEEIDCADTAFFKTLKTALEKVD